MTSDAAGTEGLAAALGDVTERTRALVRAEIDSVRGELQRKMAANVPGLLFAGLASGAAVCALASGYRFSVQVVERIVPRPYGAGVATVGYGAVAAAASVAAVRRMRRAPTPFPEETVAATREGLSAAVSS